MHSVSEREVVAPVPSQVLEDAITLVVEGRVSKSELSHAPNLKQSFSQTKMFTVGPHCPGFITGQLDPSCHLCSDQHLLCVRYKNLKKAVKQLDETGAVVVEVYLGPSSHNISTVVTELPHEGDIMLERWTFSLTRRNSFDSSSNYPASLNTLFIALRSSLHFSQLASWFVNCDGQLPANVFYRVCTKAEANTNLHNLTDQDTKLPLAAIDANTNLQISFKSLPRLEKVPVPVRSTELPWKTLLAKHGNKFTSDEWEKRTFSVQTKENVSTPNFDEMVQMKKQAEKAKLELFEKAESAKKGVLFDEARCLEGPILDDRMKITCEMSGKHHCRSQLEEEEEAEFLPTASDDRPKRRRSISRPYPRSFEMQEELKSCFPDSERILHGKFKEVDEESETYSFNIATTSTRPSFASNIDLTQAISNQSELGSENPFLEAILRTLRLGAPPEMKTVAVNTEWSFPPCLTIDLDAVSKPRDVSPTHSLSDELRRSKPCHPAVSLCRKLDFSGNPEKPAFSSALSRRIKELNSSYTSKDDIQSHDSLCERPVVPSAMEQKRFRRSLESATHLIFHRKQGLPLLHSAAPHSAGTSRFAYDSSLNSVSAIRSALLGPACFEDETEPEMAIVPISPGAASACAAFPKSRPLSPLPMLGSFEESVLHGRLEPVSTVQGFTAELGANGSFIPPHLHLPVTVFFYTLCDNDKISSPYLGHINLVKKGYNVPREGTIQLTLFNPLKTVVKMFVVPYDLSDMPPSSCTFLRQRTLYVPTGANSDSPCHRRNCHKYSRYLIHLRFCSSKSGKIYLHTDIRMVIFRKSDADTAAEMLSGDEKVQFYELRAQTYGPDNPKYSNK